MALFNFLSGDGLMTIKGAGILPRSVLNGDEHFLLVKEGGLFSSEWAEPGGIIDPGETVRGAAIRETYEESRGTLGPRWYVWLKLGLWPSAVDVRPYRCYLMNLPQSYHNIRTQFHNSTMNTGPFGETHDIAWIPSEELYSGVVNYKVGSGSEVRLRNGKKLRGRTVGVIRRLPGYQRYLKSQVKGISSRHTTAMAVSGPSRTVPVIRLASGKEFAVLKTGTSTGDLVLRDCSSCNPHWKPGLLQRMRRAVLSPIFGPPKASRAEYNIIYAAIKGESAWSKIRRNILSFLKPDGTL